MPAIYQTEYLDTLSLSTILRASAGFKLCDKGSGKKVNVVLSLRSGVERQPLTASPRHDY